jgi:alpha-amylase
MAGIVFYFHVHQPYRIKPYDIFSIGDDSDYFHQPKSRRLDNQAIIQKVAQKCYLPTNRILLELIEAIPDFKVSFSISGVILEQFQEFVPEVLDSFRSLVETRNVELVNETQYHSLASVFSETEFIDQIVAHKHTLQDLFGYTPTAFRNTELIYNNGIAQIAEKLGYKVILAEGVDRYLGWRSPNFVYQPQGTQTIKLLLKNYKLSDDIAFRFSSKNWSEYPLTAEKFAHWVSRINGNGQVVNLFMDYETFGEHQWSDTGIFDFLRRLPFELNKHPDNRFMTVTQSAHAFEPVSKIDFPDLTSWADLERDLSAWLSNPMQDEALRAIASLESAIKQTQNPQLLEDWRRLTTSDHFYYMCTKWFSDGDVHKYFSPNKSPYEAFTNYMTVLHDLRLRVYADTNIH